MSQGRLIFFQARTNRRALLGNQSAFLRAGLALPHRPNQLPGVRGRAGKRVGCRSVAWGGWEPLTACEIRVGTPCCALNSRSRRSARCRRVRGSGVVQTGAYLRRVMATAARPGHGHAGVELPRERAPATRSAQWPGGFCSRHTKEKSRSRVESFVR